MSGFEDKIAVVTGAAQGIGLAVAEALAAQGARVAMVDVQQDRLCTEAQRLFGQGRRVQAWPVDVRRAAEVEACIAGVMAQWGGERGGIDILVNTAGILHLAPLLETSEAQWGETFDVNTRGVFLMSRAVAARMVPRRQGAIVTVGSNAASVPRTHMGAYAASKAASAQFTRCLGLELAPHGIRCNTVSPGSTDTAMQRALWAGQPQDQAAARVIRGDLSQHRLGIPLGRIATPQDIAQAVCFLASDAARHITLHDLRVDGGASLDA